MGKPEAKAETKPEAKAETKPEAKAETPETKTATDDDEADKNETIVEKVSKVAKKVIADPKAALNKTKAYGAKANSTITDASDKIKAATGVDVKSKANNFLKKNRHIAEADSKRTNGTAESSAIVKFSAFIMIAVSLMF